MTNADPRPAAPEARGPDAPSEWPQEVGEALQRVHSVFGCYCGSQMRVEALNDLVAAALRAHPAGEPPNTPEHFALAVVSEYLGDGLLPTDDGLARATEAARRLFAAHPAAGGGERDWRVTGFGPGAWAVLSSTPTILTLDGFATHEHAKRAAALLNADRAAPPPEGTEHE